MTNPKRFGPGFVLPFTHKTWIGSQNFPVSSWIRKLLNPKLKVETLYLDTYESEFPCSANALRIRISTQWILSERDPSCCDVSCVVADWTVSYWLFHYFTVDPPGVGAGHPTHQCPVDRPPCMGPRPQCMDPGHLCMGPRLLLMEMVCDLLIE